MGTYLEESGYRVSLENSKTIFSDVSNIGGRRVTVTVEILRKEGYTLLSVEEQHGQYRDPDYFSYSLRLNENTALADVLGWLCGLSEHAATSVLKHLRKLSKLEKTWCQSASTDLDYFNPWSGQFMDKEERSKYIDKQKEKRQSDNESRSFDAAIEVEVDPWRDVHSIPDPRLFEE